MLLGFKTELKVSKQQRLLLAQHAGVARHAWNQGLALCQQVLIHNKLNPEDKIKFPTSQHEYSIDKTVISVSACCFFSFVITRNYHSFR
ncbi:helix-turn-helix domain-containing protein [Sphaerospermopsis torques-reginae]|uniref:helix-turn-helix domain-containing protein n=1 Tax=Sphaerospermopsis torques-reginae TaxID=984207 RepID=UPI001FE809EC|nr:helix-turn-helix domain-containing protein [Sphaerospermopsis torques-reginae]